MYKSSNYFHLDIYGRKNMWVGEGMLNEDVGSMENAVLNYFKLDPKEAEKIFTSEFTSGPCLLKGMTAS